MNAEPQIRAAAPAAAPRGTPVPTVHGRKVDQVIEGARQVFLRDGFEGASVDAIAREAGVSKATLYSYFADKRVLFMHVGRCECQRQSGIALGEIDAAAAPRDVLMRVGERMIAFLTSEFGERIFRICVAEADRFPALGREFYESGPMVMRAHMVGYLKGAVLRGQLDIQDFELAADQFAELCKVDLFPRMIFGVGQPSDAERTRIVVAAVDMFMARYGA